MEIDVFQILHKECVATKIKSKKKADILRELTQLAMKSPALEGIDEETVYQMLKTREEQGSTGIGNGLAIPHSSVPGMKDFAIVLSVSKRGVNFGSIDKHKAHIFAVILGPENQPKTHIQLLAQLSHIFRDEHVRHRMVNSTSPVSLYETFMSQSARCITAGSEMSRKQKIVILVVQREEIFEEIIEFLTELGIPGASVIESKGVRDILTGMPLFADFIHFFGDRTDTSRTLIFSVFENIIDELIEGIEEFTGNLDTHAGAMLMVIEPVFVKGSLALI